MSDPLAADILERRLKAAPRLRAARRRHGWIVSTAEHLEIAGEVACLRLIDGRLIIKFRPSFVAEVRIGARTPAGGLASAFGMLWVTIVVGAMVAGRASWFAVAASCVLLGAFLPLWLRHFAILRLPGGAGLARARERLMLEIEQALAV